VTVVFQRFRTSKYALLTPPASVARCCDDVQVNLGDLFACVILCLRSTDKLFLAQSNFKTMRRKIAPKLTKILSIMLSSLRSPSSQNLYVSRSSHLSLLSCSSMGSGMPGSVRLWRQAAFPHVFTHDVVLFPC